MRDYYAHSLAGKSPGDWEPLPTHLANVAELARSFAADFAAGEWGSALGLWHDLGKYSREFQAYLLHENNLDVHSAEYAGRVDHSTAGAQLATRLFGDHPTGRILAYCIAGHHAGLADAMSASGGAGLDQRLAKAVPPLDKVPSHLLERPALPDPNLSVTHKCAKRFQFQLGLWTRMLFSSLVDADFLATESFMSPARHQFRTCESPSFEAMNQVLDDHLSSLGNGQAGKVASARADVLAACRAAADETPGLFSLTVPTGGGKTLSSLAFALRHAKRFDMSRVIYAIPFTSIIDQTAAVFREVFRDLPGEMLIEHHSNMEPEDSRETTATRLACENWDAPLIVTTNVQLFESLFGSKTSRCRKLHNVCRSVIVLDEFQTIPVELLEPTLAVLRELAADYQCTIVMCTATQPAVQRSPEFAIGLDGIREIIPDPQSLYKRLKRVTVRHIGKQTDDALLELLVRQKQFLCIVNTRRHAATMFGRLREAVQVEHASDLFHLSTFMCGQHRIDTLKKIREHLNAGRPCRIVSTQLVEAGVDIDLPVVFRALTGVDSIAQAAGRCNREGHLPSGDVFVFQPTDVQLRGYLRTTAEAAAELLSELDANDMDLLGQKTLRRYFELHFHRHSDRWDAKEVMECFPAGSLPCRFNFRSAAERYRWIDDVSKSVFVPYRDGALLINELRQIPNERPDQLRRTLRKLQRYSVGLYENVYNEMVGRDIEILPSGQSVLINASCYDAKLGLRPDLSGFQDVDSLIA